MTTKTRIIFVCMAVLIVLAFVLQKRESVDNTESIDRNSMIQLEESTPQDRNVYVSHNNEDKVNNLNNEHVLGKRIFIDPASLVGVSGIQSFEWVEESAASNDMIKDVLGRMRFSSSGKDLEPKALTRQSAISYVDHSISMAYPPVKGLEIDGYFLFSGGTRTGPVGDFSTGIAVDKRNGDIFLW